MNHANENEVLEHFNSKCREIHDSMCPPPKNGLLYHYTDYYGLEKIIQQQRLWFANYKCLNDPTEIKYAQDIIEKISKEYNNDLLNDLLNKFFDAINHKHNIYIACFSESIEKLSLWRYYASNGCGVAIGFDEDMNSHRDSENSANYTEPNMIKVTYGEKSEELIRQFFDLFQNLYNQIDPASFKKNIYPAFLTHLLAILPVFKHESFEEEAEFRWVHQAGLFCLNPLTKQPYVFEDKYKPTASKLPESKFLPFVKQRSSKTFIYPEKFLPSAIKEIWIGPCCEFLEARDWIVNLLSENGFNIEKIKIEKAPLPYQI